MGHVSARLLYWLPRILGMAFAIFLGVFALDVFDERLGFWQTVFAFLLHLAPAVIILCVLIIAWRWERLGAGLYLVASALYAFWALPHHLMMAAVVISGAQALIALLFLIDGIERSKAHAAF